jgi:hypothetical protein
MAFKLVSLSLNSETKTAKLLIKDGTSVSAPAVSVQIPFTPKPDQPHAVNEAQAKEDAKAILLQAANSL